MHRSGAHSAQTTRPHALQWCLRRYHEKETPQTLHSCALWSGIHAMRRVAASSMIARHPGAYRRHENLAVSLSLSSCRSAALIYNSQSSVDSRGDHSHEGFIKPSDTRQRSGRIHPIPTPNNVELLQLSAVCADKKEMSDEAAVLKKELQQVKSRAVSKIKSLQATVDDLTAKLNAATAKDSADARVSPLESSEDDVSSASSGSGFVKVGTPPAESAAAEVLRHRERELEMREAALAQREERLVQR